MSSLPLKQRVEARDSLISSAEAAALNLREQALAALKAGDFDRAEAAMARSDVTVQELLENLRIYQAELHAQAEELSDSQARTEDALNRFSALFANLPVAAFLVSANGEVLEHNRKANEVFRFRARNLPDRFFHRLIEARHYQDQVRPAFHEARAMGASVCSAVEFVTEGGTRFLGELNISSLPASRAGRVQFACVVIDRSEQIGTLEALRDSNARLAASEAFLSDTAHLAHIGGWEYTVATSELRWSHETRSIHGVDDDYEPTVDAALAFYTPESRPLIAAAFEAALSGGVAFDVELDLLNAAGQRLRVRAVGHPELFDGSCVRVSGVFQDITAHHRAQREIGELTARLGMANDAGGIGVWDWDLLANRAFLDGRMRALLGLDMSPVNNLRAAVVQTARADAASIAAFDLALRAALEGLGHLNVELRLGGMPTGTDKGQAGRGERFVRLTGRVDRDGVQRPIRLIGCAWDCTPEKQAERLLIAKESAEFASRAKSAFLSRMSHELRTPLNAIMGFSQLMRLEAENGDMTVKPHRVVYIETAAKHLLELINEVLDVSQVESGQVRMEPVNLGLQALVAECLPLIQNHADDAGVRLVDLTADEPDLRVHADRLRLKEVLINLLSNAVKYNRAEGQVLVSFAADDLRVSLTVRDTGVGMDEDQLAGLFQPFSRVGAETTTIEGSGMGLFVSKRFVELMGGSVAVASQLDQGSAFTVTLPRVH
jgi:PAS domain S-box-containing protein